MATRTIRSCAVARSDFVQARARHEPPAQFNSPMNLLRPLIVFGTLVVATLSAAESTPRSFDLPSLYHVGFWVRDIAKARAFYTDFLGYAEPYELRRPNGDLQMVVMKVNERQVIYLFTDATKILPNGDNLDHLGLETHAIEAARTHLLAQGVKVGSVNRGRIGDFLLGVKDPDGHAWEITQFAPEGQLLQHQGKSLAPARISPKLRSATFTTADLPATLHFYVDILGFKRVAVNASSRTNPPVRLQVPDGTEYLDFISYERKPGAEAPRAVPEYALEVEDVGKAFDELSARARRLGLAAPKPVAVGPDGLRQTSVVDPDGTRVVLKEAARQ
jgi:catechol 2,3-dioxygenase-like lactoylglutathione lyase family enzyme